jgi:hypothetical protein
MTRTKVFLTSGTARPTLGASSTRRPIGAPARMPTTAGDRLRHTSCDA